MNSVFQQRECKVPDNFAKSQDLETAWPLQLKPLTFCALLALLLSVGCSSGTTATDVVTAQNALEQGFDFVRANNVGEALPLLDQAIETGGLNPDQFAEAMMLRAWCHAKIGDLEKAKQDQTEAEMGSPSPGLICFVNAAILEQEGDTKQAARELAKAIKLDPSLKSR